MKDKKQTPLYNAVGATKFVASAPIDEMSLHLDELPNIKIRVILKLNHRTDYRVQLREERFSKPIFISMTRWNHDETLIMLSYYLPSRIKIILFLCLIGFLLVGGLLYVVFDAPLFFFIGWGAVIFFMMLNRANSVRTLDDYKFDTNKRKQDDIMDTIISAFKQKADLNILS